MTPVGSCTLLDQRGCFCSTAIGIEQKGRWHIARHRPSGLRQAKPDGGEPVSMHPCNYPQEDELVISHLRQ